MIETLNKLKEKHFFPSEEWDERGLIPSEVMTIEEMRLAVKNFIDFLTRLYQTHETNQL